MPKKKSEKKEEANAGESVPAWVELKPKETAEAIMSLANQGRSASEIGMILRDQYGVPSTKALCGKRVSEIMKDQGIKQEIPEDMLNLIKRSASLRKHMFEHRKDTRAKRGYQLTVSKIRALASYYKKKGKMPMNWRYSPEIAELLVK